MKKVNFLAFTVLFLIFTAAVFSQEYDDYNGYNDSDNNDSYDEYDEYEGVEPGAREGFSLKAFISASYYQFPTLLFEGDTYTSDDKGAGINIQGGLNLWKDFYFQINADISLSNAPLDGLSKISGTVGWKRINAMVRYQNIKKDMYQYKPGETDNDTDSEEGTEPDSAGPVDPGNDSSEYYSPENFEILTADLQYDIFGLPFQFFEDRNLAGLFFGLTYCNYTIPASLWFDSATIAAYTSDPALHIESAGISIYFDSMISTLLYGSNIMNFDSENYSILPWISLYGNFHIGRSEISKRAFNDLNSQFAEEGAAAERQVWISGIVLDAIFGLGLIYRFENFSANVSAGFTLNVVSTTPLSASRGKYSPSLNPVFHREGWTIKAGISF